MNTATMPLTQAEKAALFVALHQAPGAFIIGNPWDAGSARILAGLGYAALATKVDPGVKTEMFQV